MAKRPKNGGLDFPKIEPGPLTWENFPEGVKRERVKLLREYRDWLVDRRISIEQELLNRERVMMEFAPLAQAGIDDAEAPSDVPLVVIEFARFSLRVLYLRRKLDLLNLYYRQASTDADESPLLMEKGDEAEMNELWEWFNNDRREEMEADRIPPSAI